ncbi:hypothetical protein HanXRQr2_Chr09g0416651 [Helianthus annuus]|uniref:Uncharacterized protein n=1 Tax=Helianthus annuus TaxID=4232 RepID=A0A9K3IAI7_HELAN|nr:hypothetical protein HanXRQr2_Chr09g0416651 [Helianthus annuus]
MECLGSGFNSDGTLCSSSCQAQLIDVKGREEILIIHSKNKKLDKNVSLNVITM